MVELIQVCHDLTNPDVEQRETKALFEAGAELSVKKLMVITWDQKKELKKGTQTIQFVPLWEWLLTETR